MTTIESHIAALIIRHINDELDSKGLAELQQWIDESPANRTIAEEFINQQQLRTSLGTALSKELIWQRIQAATQQQQTPIKKLFPWKRWIAAASIIIALFTVGYFVISTKEKSQPIAKTKEPIEVAPGSNKAVLTLADGRQIILDETQNGNVAEQGSVTIIKVDGQLAYNKSGKESEVLYNTVTVPRKGQYQLVLSDGTKIWLDAESSLRYPTSFPGKERTVELTGQGYFEVAKNAAQPFHVKTATQDVTVLGTHFNINSYDNEETVKTTLIEGLVSVIASAAKQTLKPGQEAQLNKNGTISFIKNADIEQALAWKNGQFSFKSASLRSIMNQVVRWYDVEVVYEGNQSVSLSGYVDRNVPLSETLKLLASNGVHLRQEGKKIIMMK